MSHVASDLGPRLLCPVSTPRRSQASFEKPQVEFQQRKENHQVAFSKFSNASIISNAETVL